MSDQRFLFRQFQPEFIAQELSESLLDLLGFGLWPGETEQVVVGVAAVTQPPVARITRILARQAA